MTHPLNLSLRVSALLLSLGGLASSCTPQADNPGVEYAPEMYESIPYEPLRQTGYNTINAFGINERTPATGTVARGKLNYYDHIPKDSVGIAERTLRNPFAYTKVNLEEASCYTRATANIAMANKEMAKVQLDLNLRECQTTRLVSTRR